MGAAAVIAAVAVLLLVLGLLAAAWWWAGVTAAAANAVRSYARRGASPDTLPFASGRGGSQGPQGRPPKGVDGLPDGCDEVDFGRRNYGGVFVGGRSR